MRKIIFACALLTVPLQAQTIPTYISQDSLIAWYPFNGNANDESGNGNNGTVNGAILIADKDGNENSAYSFDGVDDYIDVGNGEHLNPTDSIAVQAWIYPRSFENNKHVVSKGSNTNLYYRAYSIHSPYEDSLWTSFITVDNTEFTIKSNSIAELNKWTHLLLQFDGQFIELYINGVLEQRITANAGGTGKINLVQNEPLYFGSHAPSNVDYYFDGKINDIAIWNRTLTEGEILNAYKESNSNPKFNLADNGITVTCNEALIGETGEINGVVFTKRSKNQITPENASDTCTSGITDMSNLFRSDTTFNSNISHWDVSNVTSMSGMFMDAISFEQPLDKWDVSKVIYFQEMFRRSNYNGNIENWNVSNGINFKYTFYNNRYFNRNLSQWNIEKAENIDYMFTSTAIDEINYSKILIGWAKQNVKNGLFIEVHNLGYLTEAESYRNKLIDDYGWTIKDSGKISNGVISVSDVINKQGFNSTVTISISEVKTLNDLYSTQFDIDYPKFVEFVGIDSNSVNSNYTFEINNLDSIARIAIVSDTVIPNNVNLVNLLVQSNQLADSAFNGSITIKNALFNTHKVDSIKSGKISFTPLLIGDADDSGEINAYDAAIVLNKSMGVDILDEYVNMPWEEWRSYSSDIDKDGQILAIDASYILQRVVGLIEDFPRSTQPVESVIIEVTDRGLKIIAPEEIQSLNVSIQKDDGFRIKDLINYWENSTIANYSNGTFDLAIASSGSISGEILEIPMDVYTSDDINFEVITYSNNTKQVHSIVVNSSTVNNESEGTRPNKISLNQNYPNPFNPSTQIQYALPEVTLVTLEVFNSVGQKVMTLVNGQKSAGYHIATFDASGLSSGVYLYKLTTPSFTQTKKMLLIK